MLLPAHAHLLGLQAQLRNEKFRKEEHLKLECNNRSSGQSLQLPVSKPSLHPHSPSYLHSHGNLTFNQGDFKFKQLHILSLCEQGKLAGAVHALSLLETSTSDTIYFALLRACNRRKDSFVLKQVYGHLLQHSVNLTGPLGDYLVGTLAKYGSLEEALKIFHHLANRSVSTWNSVMSACNQRRQSGKTLQLYALMQEDHVEPDCHTFENLIKACSRLRDLEQGARFHAEARVKGMASDVTVSNSLVNMYGKCGSIIEAEGVFNEMPERNVGSWVAMMSANVDVDRGETALQLYRQMLVEENMRPNLHAYVIALQACCSLLDSGRMKGISFKMICLEIGQALHADARRSGVVSNPLLSSMLVHMYGKLGSLKDAENVFLSMSHHDCLLSNAMLSTYLEHGLGDSALQLYRHMLLQSMVADEKTLVLTVQACGVLAEKEVGVVMEGRSTKVLTAELARALHDDARDRGFSSNVFLSTTLLGVYAKCGIMSEAEKVFCELGRPDSVSWTAMISAYNEQGHGESALQLYRQMQEEGFYGNTQTFVVAIQACAILGEKVEGTGMKELLLNVGMALHADARKRKLDSNIFVGTALVGMYGNCEDIGKAEDVFSTLRHRDLVSWNAMLSTYVDRGYGEKALQLYQKMQEEGVTPDQKTYVILLQACGSLEEKKAGRGLDRAMPRDVVLALHDDIRRRGFVSDVFIGNTLVALYGNFGNLMEAEDVFSDLCLRPTISWNAMLSTYVQLNRGEQALQLFDRMQEEGTAIDDVTLVCVLQASSQMGNLRLCKEIHFSILSAGYELTPSLASTLIHAYGNCGSMPDAQKVFDALSHPDIVSWNACIGGYGGEGNYTASIQMLECMQAAGTHPDEVTLTAVLSSCSHCGFVTEGLEHFESLCRIFHISPDIKHFSSMTDLLGRAGDLAYLETVIEKLPIHADMSIWLPLMGACYLHSNSGLGKEAFSQALNSNTEEASAFIVMSNLLSDFGSLELTEEDEEYRWWKN